MTVCPNCAHENADDARFCSQCATPLGEATAAREERKVVTCLFCDLVGFTARAESMDPEDVRRLLQPYHERVRGELERFGGTVEKFIGDAVMAVFGAPVAHEDDPERAVRAALVIRDGIVEEGELEVRIGITTGEALVALDARPDAGEGMASGDIVNTAARLQSAAPVNGILVDEKTYRATARAIAYATASAVDAKGKAMPVVAWEAREATARFGVDVRQHGGTALVGRGSELETLVAALERARREREPQLVTLVGVPGIGKSRLLWELFEHLDAGTELTTWRQGRSLPYGDGVSFWALSEIVKAQAGILETDDGEQATKKLRAAIAALAGNDDPAWLERHLRPLVGLETRDEGGGADRQTEVYAAWRRFLELLAEQRPLVLVFEDLHWADDALLDFVDYLVEWARGVPLLVLATARPELLERRPSWGGGKPNAATLTLQPLSDDETSELVHALLGTPVLDAPPRAELVARAEGNPLYAEEFARLLADGRSHDELPETVQGLIAARLDGLGQNEKVLLQAASVVGKVFWLGSVATLASTPRWTAEELVHGLERKEFVRSERRSSVAGEAEYDFRHSLVRDVAYGQIPRADRAELHRRAAEWIESLGRSDDHAETLAHHYLSALELTRAAGQDERALVERARAATEAAGDRARALNAYPAAARFYSHAMTLAAPDDPARAELELRLGDALLWAGDESAERVLTQAAQSLVAAGRPELAAEAHILLNLVWWDRGDRDRSAAELERALELVGPGDSESRARVLAARARLRVLADDYDAAARIGAEARDLAERLELVDVGAHALGSIGIARIGGGDLEGLRDLERSVEITTAASSIVAVNLLNNLAFMYTILGDVRRDRELRREAKRMSERFGEERMRRFASLSYPMLDYYAGDWEVALADLQRIYAEFEAGQPHYLEPVIRASGAMMSAARGDLDAALSDATLGLEAARTAKDPQLLLPAAAVHLRIRVERGELDEAALVARELLEQKPRHAAVCPAVELAFAAGRLGNGDDVHGWIERIPYESRWSDAALALLDGELDRAAGLFAEIGSLPDEARARLRARDEANVRLAREFWRSVGATRYVSEADALLGEISEISA